MKPGVLPSWTVWIRHWRIRVDVTVEGAVLVDPGQDEADNDQWGLLEDMSPDEAANLAGALRLASDAAREMGK